MNIIVVANRQSSKTLDALFQIIAYLDMQGIGHAQVDVTDLPDAAFACSASADEVAKRYGGAYDLIITLGGDGTILHTARLANVIDAPILGINYGHLGFLANTGETGAIPLIADVLAGEIIGEQRVNLEVRVNCFGDDEYEEAPAAASATACAATGTAETAGATAAATNAAGAAAGTAAATAGTAGSAAAATETAAAETTETAGTRAGTGTAGAAAGATGAATAAETAAAETGRPGRASGEARTFFALNEIAIARGAMGHIVDFSFDVSGDRIATMRGDGLVIATATGSTAYSLSAGGPLVGPSHRGMIITPLAPHTLNSRAIVAEHHDVVEVTFEEGSPSSSEVSLFADGDALSFDRPISSIVVTTGPRPTTLLTRREESFYKQVARTFFK